MDTNSHRLEKRKRLFIKYMALTGWFQFDFLFRLQLHVGYDVSNFVFILQFHNIVFFLNVGAEKVHQR